MDGRPTWTDCDEAGDYVVPNVLSPRDLVFRPDNMDETVPHTHYHCLPFMRGGVAQWIGRRISDHGVPGSLLAGAHFVVALSKSHLPSA